VTACTHGVPVSPEEKRLLEANGIACREEPIVRFEGSPGPNGLVERIAFATGPPLECAAVFFNTDKFQRSDLPRMLGCECAENGEIVTDSHHYTKVPGLYLAGDSDGDVQFVIVAAAEGAKAAVHINRELQKEDIVHTASSNLNST
jgi:thioredoxin reductase